MYASVILDLSIGKALDYLIPEEMRDQAKKGARVTVPVRGRFYKGTILSLKEKSDFSRVLPVQKISSDEESIPEPLFELALWMSRYYASPLSRVFKTILPAPLRKEVKPKLQGFVMRKKSKEELRSLAVSLRIKAPRQAAVLDCMLKVKKGILFSELLEKTGSPATSVHALVEKGCLELDILRIDRSPLTGEEYFKTEAKKLNGEQQQAFIWIEKDLEAARFQTHLIHGVTGSGKTEIYLQSIQKALDLKRGAIVLVPEISLTTQMIERFQSRFGKKIAVLHHRLSSGERYDEWQRIRSGRAPLALGARSAIFSPVKNLGLIIVDEEHEQTYKQSEESPCYHARDLAVMRGKLEGAVVILGSATPSLESYSNARSGKYRLSELLNRAQNASRPFVRLVDMKEEFEKAQGFTHFSRALLEAIQKRVEVGEQAILFLNRRGYHTSLLCKSCGKAVKCPHCDSSLAYYRSGNKMSCHLCGYELCPPPETCPSCKSSQTMSYRGAGTEQIERAIRALLPEVRTLRMDADTTRHKGSHAKLLRAFGSGKADLLIGTQMIAKGLHFPQVTLVGILNSDSSLNIPDFRASERVFQLITQVSGRAGRGDLPGEVILQTFQPENSVILQASSGDYLSFYEEEVSSRRLFSFPPFSRLAKILLSGKKREETLKWSLNLRELWSRELPSSFDFFPVAACGHEQIKDRYRFQFLIKAQNFFPLSERLDRLPMPPQTIRLQIDVDPMNTFF